MNVHMNKTLLISFLFIFTFLAEGFCRKPLDARLLHSINRCDNRAVTNFSKVVSNSEVAFLVGVPAAMIIYGYADKNPEILDKAVVTTASVVGLYAISLITKEIVRRERPYDKYPGYIINRVDESGYSFPSNHTGAAFSLATSLTLSYKKWYISAPAYLWAGAIGYSRMQLGVHYPGDVLMGALLGSATAWECHELNKLWVKKREKKKFNY